MPHMTAALDGEYMNLWPTWPHFNTGFLVLEPNHAQFEDILRFTNQVDPTTCYDFKGEHYVLSDQEILNMYFSDWVDHNELHLNKYYNIFPSYVNKNFQQDIIDNAYFIHFVGSKPWFSMEPKHNIANESVSVFLDFIRTIRMSIEPYEIAQAIIEMCYQNNLEDLDWETIDTNGTYESMVARVASDFFFDAETGLKYVNFALQKNKAI